MSYSTQGASNRQIYDCCAYAQALQQSVDPLQYDLYFGAVENCNKCIDNKAWFKQDREIVDIESDLWNITRPLTRCDGYKYNPNCKTGPNCISTFDPNAPKVLSPSLCPIVYNNIPVQTSPGYSVPDPANICLVKNDYRKADNINTFGQYVEGTRAILGNNADPQNVFMFMNTCDNKPLYNGSTESATPYMANAFNSATISNAKANQVPFPRMGYDLDVRVGLPPNPQLSNNNLRMGEESQQIMFGTSTGIGPESRMIGQKNLPAGMRLPMLSTKGKSANPTQLFDSDNDSIYDSDGEYEQA